LFEARTRYCAEWVARQREAVGSTRQDRAALAKSEAAEGREAERAGRQADLWLRQRVAEQQKLQGERWRRNRLMVKMQREQEREEKLTRDRLERRRLLMRSLNFALSTVA